MSATKDNVKSLMASMDELKETVAKIQEQVAAIEESLPDVSGDDESGDDS
jgi:hypothetical protein